MRWSSPLSIPSSCFAIPGPTDDGGFAVVPWTGASQRASLAFALLAAAALASDHASPALHGPDWVDETAPVPAAIDR